MSRTFVMGDPQAPFRKVREVLASHDALAGDRLAPDVTLISIGDHFDYDFREAEQASQEGLDSLRWLASHDRDQVELLLGNHDISRVQELARITDHDFKRARALAQSIDQTEKHEGKEAARRRERDEFSTLFPGLPCSGVVGRDFASFTTEQRALMIELLLGGRFHLALTGVLDDGRDVLLTHAGVTRRELHLLGIPEAREARPIAAALEAHLVGAIARVRTDWERGETTPLSLEPLHLAGGDGEEGGGLLYHRPTNPAHGKLDPLKPRRYDPHTLPVGVTQVVGHTGHSKCMEELGAWVAPAARQRQHGGIRTLRVGGAPPVYDLGIAPPHPATADMIFIDGELRRVPAAEFALLELARLDR